ncbi:MAG: hypothetical protein NZ853_10425 [Leptospiraceae bacterium]|nr:hypothetical protein [Leptospiraceae bacterium]MDW7974929.1 hypothetical protein [Leptospiraceae bacterium]
MNKLWIYGWILLIGSCQTLPQKKQNIVEFYGEWQIDYEQTIQELMESHSLDKELHEDLYKNLLQQIREEYSDASLKLRKQEQQNQWEFTYTVTKNSQPQKNTQKGTFTYIPISETKYTLELTSEEKEKEILQIEILQKDLLKITLQNPQPHLRYVLYLKRKYD